MPRPSTTKKLAHELSPGIVIRSNKFNTKDLRVSRISIVLHLENGSDEVYAYDSDVKVVDPQPKEEKDA